MQPFPLPREGRVPTTGDDEIDNDPNVLPPSDLSAPQSETYVIQIPKDQIYHISPPENALLAECHCTSDRNDKHKMPILVIDRLCHLGCIDFDSPILDCVIRKRIANRY